MRSCQWLRGSDVRSNTILMNLEIGHPKLRLHYLLQVHPRALVYVFLFLTLSVGYALLRGGKLGREHATTYCNGIDGRSFGFGCRCIVVS
jgi:hypothetical protein